MSPAGVGEQRTCSPDVLGRWKAFLLPTVETQQGSHTKLPARPRWAGTSHQAKTLVAANSLHPAHPDLKGCPGRGPLAGSTVFLVRDAEPLASPHSRNLYLMSRLGVCARCRVRGGPDAASEWTWVLLAAGQRMDTEVCTKPSTVFLAAFLESPKT